LLETTLNQGWKGGAELLSSKFPTELQTSLQVTTECLFTSRAHYVGEQEQREHKTK